jgi:hypothetical protein
MFEKAVREAEEKWLPRIRPFLIRLFENSWIPSHDITHHERVWKNARSLISNLPGCDISFIEQLMLACYFHDTGLIRVTGDKHGKESRLLCEAFVGEYSRFLSGDITLMLDAVEFHDDKEYTGSNELRSNKIYTILSLADDMDAFGAVGAYRYIEIYLLRGIDPNDIPSQVLSNASKRFSNCVCLSRSSDLSLDMNELIHKYKMLRQLFLEGSFAESASSIVLWIRKELINKKRSPLQMSVLSEAESCYNSRVEFFIENIRFEVK